MKFTDKFFEAEIREGFAVPEMMKRAWAAELEILRVVIDICERNHLQYFADAGTLLGAVRHQGFIPWDDDVDICLKREDYNRLIQIMSQELPYGFSMTGTYAESERLRGEASIPELRVIADKPLWNYNEYMKRFHGFPYNVGIDIFSLDYIPRDSEQAEIQKIIVRNGSTLLRDWDTLEQRGELAGRIEEIEFLCNMKMGDNIRVVLPKILDAVTALYGREEADDMTNYVTWILHDNYKMKKSGMMI